MGFHGNLLPESRFGIAKQKSGHCFFELFALPHGMRRTFRGFFVFVCVLQGAEQVVLKWKLGVVLTLA